MSFKIMAEYEDRLKFELSLRDNPRMVEGQVRLVAYIVSKLARVRDPTPYMTSSSTLTSHSIVRASGHLPQPPTSHRSDVD